jgi:hypothetical protein
MLTTLTTPPPLILKMRKRLQQARRTSKIVLGPRLVKHRSLRKRKRLATSLNRTREMRVMKKRTRKRKRSTPKSSVGWSSGKGWPR